MDELEIIYNDNEDNLAMEVDIITIDENDRDSEDIARDVTVSQNSTLPLNEGSVPANIEGNEVTFNSESVLENSEDNGEITLHYDAQDDTETISTSTTDSRIHSPHIFEDDSSNHSDNNMPPPPPQDSDSKLNESPVKKRCLDESVNEDEGRTCPICFDNWTNTGDHRICSLRCGHLFGMSCIKRWLNSETRKSCPTCKKKVNPRHDIRYIYAKKLVAIDTTEVDIVKKQLETVSEEKNRIQIDLTKAVCREHLLMQQVDDCKKKIQVLTSKLEVREQYGYQPSSQTSSSQNSDLIRLYMDKSLDLSKDGGCRVLDCKNNLDLIVTSMKSPNSFFSGYGVRKINLTHYKPTGFIGLHKSQIRDIKFHAQNPWLASVSLDKVVKILDINSNVPIASVTGNCPLWSCCWDGDNPHMLFVGEQQGAVIKYDMRRMTEPVATLFVPGDMSPVVALAAIKQDPGSPVAYGGVTVCKLNSVWFFENTPNDYTRLHFPVEGPFVSMSYQNSTKQLLLSSRPNSRTPYARHVVCNINREGESLRCDTIHCFPGGPTQKLLSRSCFLSNRSDYVAAYHENQKCVCMWNINTGRKACSVPAHDPVIDLCGIQSNGAYILLQLTEKKLEFFKFTE